MMSDHRVQNISSKQTLTTAAVMARFGLLAQRCSALPGVCLYGRLAFAQPSDSGPGYGNV